VFFFPQVSPPKPCILLSPIRATCPFHLIFLDFITCVILGEEYRSLGSTLCSFLHSRFTSSLLGPNIFLSTLFSNILNLCSSLSVTETKFHTHTSQQAQLKFGKYFTYHWRSTQLSWPYNCQFLKVLCHPLMGVCHLQWRLLTKHILSTANFAMNPGDVTPIMCTPVSFTLYCAPLYLPHYIVHPCIFHTILCTPVSSTLYCAPLYVPHYIVQPCIFHIILCTPVSSTLYCAPLYLPHYIVGGSEIF